MKSDSFLITRQAQPGLSWQVSAVRFEETRTKFLEELKDPQRFVGDWHISCFLFKGVVGCKYDALTKDQLDLIKKAVREFREFTHQKSYDRRAGIQALFIKYLVDPPYPLSDNWDGNATTRRARAEEIAKTKGTMWLLTN